MVEIHILGETYTIDVVRRDDDPVLEDTLGYCDKTSKKITVRSALDNGDPRNVCDLNVLQQTTLRHEIVHAFLFESGLHNWSEQNEDFVDWIATQIPKLKQAMETAGCLT